VAPLRPRARPDAAPTRKTAVPGDRKSDTRKAAASPRPDDRRAASGCLWDACEALLSAHGDPRALAHSLDALQRAFDCAGVALHAVGPRGKLEPWCARGDWETKNGDLRECMGVPLFRGTERVGALDLRGGSGQRWRAEQLALVRTAAGALGAALGARLELDRLRRAPGRDPVTGLADAPAFHQRLLEEVGRSTSITSAR
jgi:hypothetical protein